MRARLRRESEREGGGQAVVSGGITRAPSVAGDVDVVSVSGTTPSGIRTVVQTHSERRHDNECSGLARCDGDGSIGSGF